MKSIEIKLCIMRSITGNDYTRKELSQKVLEWFSDEGKQFLKQLWTDKMLYVSNWGTVRLTPKGWNKLSDLQKEL